MTRAIISAFYRSPFTPAGRGELVNVRPDDLLANTLKGLVEKTGLQVDDIEDVKVGCAFPEGEQGLNVARLASAIAGLPNSAAGVTTNRFCGSSMQTIHDAAGAIAMGAGDVFICAGVESMSRIPMGGLNPAPNAELHENDAGAYMGMGETAENVADLHKVKRKLQEEFALASHNKAAAARAEGKFEDEIIPFGEVAQDGCIREGSTLEKMATLKPAFDKRGSVTAATSSPLTDGAVAVLLVSEEYADKHNLPKLAAIKSIAVSGCDPKTMGLGPIYAGKKALERAGIKPEDLSVAEINEAFSAQAIPSQTELGLKDDILNIDGGAIALGHPLGASGARITGKAASLLKREGGKYALAAMCIGGGMGVATVLETV